MCICYTCTIVFTFRKKSVDLMINHLKASIAPSLGSLHLKNIYVVRNAFKEIIKLLMLRSNDVLQIFNYKSHGLLVSIFIPRCYISKFGETINLSVTKSR